MTVFTELFSRGVVDSARRQFPVESSSRKLATSQPGVNMHRCKQDGEQAAWTSLMPFELAGHVCPVWSWKSVPEVCPPKADLVPKKRSASTISMLYMVSPSVWKLTQVWWLKNTSSRLDLVAFAEISQVKKHYWQQTILTFIPYPKPGVCLCLEIDGLGVVWNAHDNTIGRSGAGTFTNSVTLHAVWAVLKTVSYQSWTKLFCRSGGSYV